MGIKRFTEYLAYEILHRPDSRKGFLYIYFFHFQDSRLNGLHFIFDGVTVKTDAETVKYAKNNQE